MTQRHISHLERLPACAAGHCARHILDLRGQAAGGSHFVECAFRHTARHRDFHAALAAWKRMSRPPHALRNAVAEIPAHHVLQPLHLTARVAHVAKGGRGVGS